MLQEDIDVYKRQDDGWLRMYDDSNLAKEYVEESKLPEYKVRCV